MKTKLKISLIGGPYCGVEAELEDSGDLPAVVHIVGDYSPGREIRLMTSPEPGSQRYQSIGHDREKQLFQFKPKKTK